MRYFLVITLLVTMLLSWYSCSRDIDAQEPELGVQESKSADFEMTVNGQPVFVYQARVSAYPINQVWPGYQRPMEQTEIASFAYFDFSREVTVRVTSAQPINTWISDQRNLG